MIDNWADSRVHLLTGPHAGRPAVPRNRGIAAARGEWLAFLDDDDSWLPDKLRTQLCHAHRLGVRAVASNAYRVHGSGTYLEEGLPEIITFTQLLDVNTIICSSALIHRSVFLSHGIAGFPEKEELKAYEDYALWLRITDHENFGYVDAPLLFYNNSSPDSIRLHAGNDKRNRGLVYRDYLLQARLRAVSVNGMLALRRYVSTILG